MCRGDYVVRLDETTGLQLWSASGQLTLLAGGAQWLQACHDAGIEIRLQINESHTQEEGGISESVPADQTDTWYRPLDVELQSLGISGLTETVRQVVMAPEESIRSLPAPARLLHMLRESPEVFALTASTCEEETGEVLNTLLIRAGFTANQVKELQTHSVRWPLMNEEEDSRYELD
jgi:hypothetical protein